MSEVSQHCSFIIFLLIYLAYRKNIIMHIAFSVNQLIPIFSSSPSAKTSLFEKNNIGSVELVLRHNNIFLTDTCLPYSIFLAQPILCERQQGCCLYHFLHLWYGVAGIGTHDLPLRKRKLYQLSYRGGVLSFKRKISLKRKYFL